MIWIVPIQYILIVVVILMLLVGGIGYAVISSLKVVIFSIVALGGLTVVIYLFVFLCISVCNKELKSIGIAVINIWNILWSIGIAPTIDDCRTCHCNSNVFLLGALLVGVTSIVAVYLVDEWEEHKNKKRLTICIWASFIIFAFVLFTRLWIIGARIDEIEKNDNNENGSIKSYIVQVDEVEIYKNTYLTQEKNELIGIYSKGTILQIRGSKIEHYKGTLSNGFLDDTEYEGNSSIEDFLGIFVTPEGEEGYIAIKKGEGGTDYVVVNERNSKVDDYEKKRLKIFNVIGNYLYKNIDLFGLKTYTPKKEKLL